jgi:hypothetical protein
MDDPDEKVDDGPTPLPASITQAGQPQAGNGNLSTNTRWDGAISKHRMGHLATIPVTVRWDSAAVMRQALVHEHDASAAAVSAAAPNNFIITVVGLLPSKQVKGPAAIENKSSSDDGTAQARSTEEILEWFMGNSLLMEKGLTSIRPQNVQVDPDSGVIHMFFARSDAFVAHKKEIQFVTRFGSMSLVAHFRLKDMVVDGKPDL